MTVSLFTKPGDLTPADIIKQLTFLALVPQSLAAAIKLGIPDLLASEAQSAEALAAATSAHAPSLYRILRLLAGCNILREDDQHHFHLTEVGQALCTTTPGTPERFVWFQTLPWRGVLYQALSDVVMSGNSAYEHIYGKRLYEVLAEQPELSQAFNQGMRAWSTPLPDAVLATYDFSQAHTVVDVGGGYGQLLCPILQAYPPMQGILFDQPYVIQEAQTMIAQTPIANRCTLVGGTFLEQVPAGGDIYMIAFVLMDWSDEEAIRILRNCRAAMGAGGKILILETLIGPANEPDFGKFLDIDIMLETSGRVRTLDEFRSLLAAAGLLLTHVYTVSALSTSILEAVRAQ